MPRCKRICKKLLKKRIKTLLTSIIPYETNFSNRSKPHYSSLYKLNLFLFAKYYFSFPLFEKKLYKKH